MSEVLILTLGFGSLMVGSFLGYFARQSIAKRKADTLEATLHKRLSEAKEKADRILIKSKKQAKRIIEEAEAEERERKRELIKTERFLREKESGLEKRSEQLIKKERSVLERVKELRETKETIKDLRRKAERKLEELSGLSKGKAKKELLNRVEEECSAEVLDKIRRLEEEGERRYERKAKEILVSVIQRQALSQVQELTTSVLALPNDEIKGRIIGKRGRNIKVLEQLTGTEIVVDDTPETVVISAFNPIRRQIAKLALEKLVRDGRIQPAHIEKEVKEAEEQIKVLIKKAGEQAVFQTGILGLNPKIIQLLGRLHFRTSYGQNVLSHSIEVSQLAGALAGELDADIDICKRAGLLHDIGKAIDHQVEGSHVEIGIKILQRLGEPEEIINAMKSHHGDYKAETIEAVLVQVADQISGARPGARKENLEDYLMRLRNLEKMAHSFSGIADAYAIQAGRELRVFVKPEEINDLQARKLARELAAKIQQELKYPGEIKVTVIREKRVVEYAK